MLWTIEKTPLSSIFTVQSKLY